MDDTEATARNDPLRPLDVITKVAGVLFLGVLVALVVLTTLGMLGVARGTVGLEDVCVTVPTYTVPFGTSETTDPFATGEGSATHVKEYFVHGLAPGATFDPASLSLCAGRPSAWLRVVFLFTSLPMLLAFGGFLLLVRVLVSRARSRGLFTPDVARLTAVLGWYILLGVLAASLAEAVATAAVVDRAVPGRFDVTTVQYVWATPWTALFAGAGVLSIARVLQRATVMRQDLDATI